MSRLVASMGRATPRLLEAFRTGGGVAWDEFGPDLREAQAAQNRVVPRTLTRLASSGIAVSGAISQSSS